MQVRFVLLSVLGPPTVVLGIVITYRMGYTIHDTHVSSDTLTSECITYLCMRACVQCHF